MLFEVTGRDRRPLFVAVRIETSPRLVPKLTQKAFPGMPRAESGKLLGKLQFSHPTEARDRQDLGERDQERGKKSRLCEVGSWVGGLCGIHAAIPAPRACGKIPSGRVRQSQQRRKSGRAGPSFEMLCRGQPCTKNGNAMPLMSPVTPVTSPVTCPACSL